MIAFGYLMRRRRPFPKTSLNTKRFRKQFEKAIYSILATFFKVFKMQNLKESEALALSAPFPYVLVTSQDKNRRPNAMGVAWVTRGSFEP